MSAEYDFTEENKAKRIPRLQGFEAGKESKTLADNPYDADNPEEEEDHFNWLDGWVHGKRNKEGNLPCPTDLSNII